MTTTNERKEAVERAVADSWSDETEYDMDVLVDGVIAACLPNRADFRDAVNNLIQAVRSGTDVDAVFRIWALVYGEDAHE